MTIDHGVLGDAANAVFGEALKILDTLGLSEDVAAELADEVRALMLVMVDPSTSQTAREATWRALQGLPLRVRQQIISAERKGLLKMEAVLEGVLAVIKAILHIVQLANE